MKHFILSIITILTLASCTPESGYKLPKTHDPSHVFEYVESFKWHDVYITKKEIGFECILLYREIDATAILDCKDD